MMEEEEGDRGYPAVSLDLGQVTLLSSLLGSILSQSFKPAHSDAPQPKYSKRGGKRQEGDK